MVPRGRTLAETLSDLKMPTSRKPSVNTARTGKVAVPTSAPVKSTTTITSSASSPAIWAAGPRTVMASSWVMSSTSRPSGTFTTLI